LSTTDDIRVNHNPGDEITFGHMAHGRINALASVRKMVEGVRKGDEFVSMAGCTLCKGKSLLLKLVCVCVLMQYYWSK